MITERGVETVSVETHQYCCVLFKCAIKPAECHAPSAETCPASEHGLGALGGSSTVVMRTDGDSHVMMILGPACFSPFTCDLGYWGVRELFSSGQH